MFLSQYQSFFITLFRYICLFQNQLLVNLDLKPRNLAQITVFCLFFISVLTSSFIILGSDPPLTLQACLGNYVMLYDRNGHNICNQDNQVINFGCKLSYATYMVLSSNLVESFLLFKCFSKIRNQNENVQELIGKESYTRRRRDNGILIRISVIQWCVEMCNLVFYFIYVIFFLGWNQNVDKFFNIYNVAFVMMVQPAFYVSADANFRAIWAKYGIVQAVKSIFKK